MREFGDLLPQASYQLVFELTASLRSMFALTSAWSGMTGARVCCSLFWPPGGSVQEVGVDGCAGGGKVLDKREPAPSSQVSLRADRTIGRAGCSELPSLGDAPLELVICYQAARKLDRFRSNVATEAGLISRRARQARWQQPLSRSPRTRRGPPRWCRGARGARRLVDVVRGGGLGGNKVSLLEIPKLLVSSGDGCECSQAVWLLLLKLLP